MGINIFTIPEERSDQGQGQQIRKAGKMKKNRLYADYDFEEAYQQQIEKLEEAERERYFRKRIGAGYQTKTTKAGDHLEADIYPAFACRHDMPRTKRHNGSRPAQKNLNDKRARRYLNNLIDANFGRGDLWCTFTYDNDHLPESIDAAQKYFGNFIRRVNRRRKKVGLQNVKYVCVTEYVDAEGRPVRCHHHVIMSGDCDRDELESLWKAGGRNQTRRIDPDPDTNAAGIVTYICKQASDPKRRKGSKRWTSSRNLTKPTITKSFSKFGKKTAAKMAGDRTYLEARIRKAYPGYRFIDAAVMVNDKNGGVYIYARMVRD